MGGVPVGLVDDLESRVGTCGNPRRGIRNRYAGVARVQIANVNGLEENTEVGVCLGICATSVSWFPTQLGGGSVFQALPGKEFTHLPCMRC